MSDFNYKKYLKNNPLLQKTEVNEEKLITESKETTEEIQTEMSNPIMRKGEKGDDSIEKETEKMRMKEDDRTDAEQEGYKDGFEDAKDDIEGALKKMKVSELKAKIKEDIISLLQEDEVEYETPLEEEVDVEDKVSEDMGAGLIGSLILMIGSMGVGKVLDKIKDKYPEEVAKFNKMAGAAQRGSGKMGSPTGRFVTEDEVEIDIEDEVEIEEPKLDASVAQTGLSDDEKQIQDALKLAYDNAVAIGDEKLSDQIGNSITFFTRTHVVER